MHGAGVMRQVLAAGAGFRACERAITAQELAGAGALDHNVRVGLWRRQLGQWTWHPRTSMQHAIRQSACEPPVRKRRRGHSSPRRSRRVAGGACVDRAMDARVRVSDVRVHVPAGLRATLRAIIGRRVA